MAAAGAAARARALRCGWCSSAPSGRMGQQIVRDAPAFPGLRLSGRAGIAERSAALGRDVGAHAGAAALGVALSAALRRCCGALARVPLVLDFSTGWRGGRASGGLRGRARAAADRHHRHWHASWRRRWRRRRASIALLVARQYQLGVTCCSSWCAVPLRRCPHSYDIEIVEAHHRAQARCAVGHGARAGRGRGRRRAAAARCSGLLCAPRPQRAAAPIRADWLCEWCAVAMWSGSTRCCFSAEGERPGLTHRARIARCSRAAPCSPGNGWRDSRRGATQ